jgi:hypothetical protein
MTEGWPLGIARLELAAMLVALGCVRLRASR